MKDHVAWAKPETLHFRGETRRKRIGLVAGREELAGDETLDFRL
jgi:hypothetical protein